MSRWKDYINAYVSYYKYLFKNISDWTLGLLSAYMIYNGTYIFFKTSGFVQGTEFGMLITIVNQISLVMVWLAIFAVRSLLTSALQNET